MNVCVCARVSVCICQSCALTFKYNSSTCFVDMLLLFLFFLLLLSLLCFARLLVYVFSSIRFFFFSSPDVLVVAAVVAIVVLAKIASTMCKCCYATLSEINLLFAFQKKGANQQKNKYSKNN